MGESDTEARIEIGAPVSMSVDDNGVRVEVAHPGHAAVRAQATVGLNRPCRGWRRRARTLGAHG